MPEGNIASFLLFLLIFTASITLLLADMQHSVKAQCTETYNITIQSTYTDSDVKTLQEQQTKINSCTQNLFPNWYYALFVLPIGVVTALCIKKLAFV
jgi:hypothetical protein